MESKLNTLFQSHHDTEPPEREKIILILFVSFYSLWQNQQSLSHRNINRTECIKEKELGMGSFHAPGRPWDYFCFVWAQSLPVGDAMKKLKTRISP